MCKPIGEESHLEDSAHHLLMSCKISLVASSNIYGVVWIDALTRPPQKLALTRPCMPVWIATKELVRPAFPSHPSSNPRQFFSRTGAAKSFAY